MLRVDGFRRYLQGRNLKAEDVESSVKAAKDLERHLRAKKSTLESASVEALKEYVSILMKKGENSEERLIALARYCYYTKKNDLYVYFASILGATDVLPRINERLVKIAGDATGRKVFDGIVFPPLGMPQEDYPRLTQTIMDRMESELSRSKCREIMTWNYHQVPVSVFSDAKKRFEKSSSLDEYLKGEHERLVQEMKACMKEGRLWYEQEITPEVLEFVKNNQEINTGVRRGDKIFKVKIPYAPKLFLKENDPAMKKYYACHCQLVRTALRDGRPVISPAFCYCSAGFEKLHFDVIFGEPVEAEVLETLLNGDPRCRFAIKIPKNKQKQV